MQYEDIKELISPGDIIQIAAPTIVGVGKLLKMTPSALLIEPYIKKGYEADALPATTIVTLTDIRLLFLLKPDDSDGKQ